MADPLTLQLDKLIMEMQKVKPSRKKRRRNGDGSFGSHKLESGWNSGTGVHVAKIPSYDALRDPHCRYTRKRQFKRHHHRYKEVEELSEILRGDNAHLAEAVSTKLTPLRSPSTPGVLPKITGGNRRKKNFSHKRKTKQLEKVYDSNTPKRDTRRGRGLRKCGPRGPNGEDSRGLPFLSPVPTGSPPLLPSSHTSTFDRNGWQTKRHAYLGEEVKKFRQAPATEKTTQEEQERMKLLRKAKRCDKKKRRNWSLKMANELADITLSQNETGKTRILEPLPSGSFRKITSKNIARPKISNEPRPLGQTDKIILETSDKLLVKKKALDQKHDVVNQEDMLVPDFVACGAINLHRPDAAQTTTTVVRGAFSGLTISNEFSNCGHNQIEIRDMENEPMMAGAFSNLEKSPLKGKEVTSAQRKPKPESVVRARKIDHVSAEEYTYSDDEFEVSSEEVIINQVTNKVAEVKSDILRDGEDETDCNSLVEKTTKKELRVQFDPIAGEKNLPICKGSGLIYETVNKSTLSKETIETEMKGLDKHDIASEMETAVVTNNINGNKHDKNTAMTKKTTSKVKDDVLLDAASFLDGLEEDDEQSKGHRRLHELAGETETGNISNDSHGGIYGEKAMTKEENTSKEEDDVLLDAVNFLDGLEDDGGSDIQSKGGGQNSKVVELNKPQNGDDKVLAIAGDSDYSNEVIKAPIRDVGVDNENCKKDDSPTRIEPIEIHNDTKPTKAKREPNAGPFKDAEEVLVLPSTEKIVEFEEANLNLLTDNAISYEHFSNILCNSMPDITRALYNAMDGQTMSPSVGEFFVSQLDEWERKQFLISIQKAFLKSSKTQMSLFVSTIVRSVDSLYAGMNGVLEEYSKTCGVEDISTDEAFRLVKPLLHFPAKHLMTFSKEVLSELYYNVPACTVCNMIRQEFLSPELNALVGYVSPGLECAQTSAASKKLKCAEEFMMKLHAPPVSSAPFFYNPFVKGLFAHLNFFQSGAERRLKFNARRKYALLDSLSYAKENSLLKSNFTNATPIVFPLYIREDDGSMEEGEGSGPRKEFFSLLGQQLCLPVEDNAAPFKYLKCCESYFPNSECTDSELLRWLGFLLGCSISSRCSLGVRLPEFLFKCLIHEDYKVHQDDARHFNYDLYKSMESIQKMDEANYKQVLESDYMDAGMSKDEYIRQALDERMYQPCQWQLKLIGEGFRTVICPKITKALKIEARDFSSMVSGNEISATKNFNFHDVFKIVSDSEMDEFPLLNETLWQVIDSFSALKKRKLVKFITGIPNLPFPKSEVIRIEMPFMCFSDDEIKANLMRLPSAHTCTNTVEIPNYLECLLKIDGVNSFEELGLGEQNTIKAKLELHIEEKFATAIDHLDSMGYGLDELGQEYNNVVVTSSSGGAKDTNFSANIEKRGFSNNGAITMSSKYVPEHNKNIDGARLSDYDIISSAGDSIDSFRVDESEEDFIF
jgi:hypothetical protein